MKTAISLPDELFDRVRKHAERLGISRSEFFALAAGRWAAELEGAELTSAINDSVDAIGTDDNEVFTAAAARASLNRAG